MIRIDDSYRTLINNVDKIKFTSTVKDVSGGSIKTLNPIFNVGDIKNYLKKSQVFIMEYIKHSNQAQVKEQEPYFCELDAPFSNCLIQITDAIFQERNISVFILLIEAIPKHYECFLIRMVSNTIVARKCFAEEVDNFVKPYIDKINTSNTVYIESRVRNKSKGSAPRMSNESIIYVSSNRVYASDVVLVGGRISKVSCKFMVRGHWRKLQDSDKLGKDRAGIYNTVGYTWITEHIKGADNTNEVKQLRVLTS
jgi:L-fucose mutarotase/ribose pyranase (RbsD/FucU family)